MTTHLVSKCISVVEQIHTNVIKYDIKQQAGVEPRY